MTFLHTLDLSLLVVWWVVVATRALALVPKSAVDVNEKIRKNAVEIPDRSSRRRGKKNLLRNRCSENNFCFDELVIFLLAQAQQITIEVFVVFRQQRVSLGWAGRCLRE